MAIKNVAIAGVSPLSSIRTIRNPLTKPRKATGNIGSAIVKALLNSNQFNVTALTRSESTSKAAFPDNVYICTVDYSNHSTLVDALKGQDAVVSA